jgi:hypothetical protein
MGFHEQNLHWPLDGQVMADALSQEDEKSPIQHHEQEKDGDAADIVQAGVHQFALDQEDAAERGVIVVKYGQLPGLAVHMQELDNLGKAEVGQLASELEFGVCHANRGGAGRSRPGMPYRAGEKSGFITPS